jgi:tRNA-dihydrouridine synthase A
VDGVMLGRAAYHDPYLLAELDAALHGGAPPRRERVVHALVEYAAREVAQGESLRAIVRHALGLFHGLPGARLWRRMLCDPARLAANDTGLLLAALDAVTSPIAEAA